MIILTVLSQGLPFGLLDILIYHIALDITKYQTATYGISKGKHLYSTHFSAECILSWKYLVEAH